MSAGVLVIAGALGDRAVRIAQADAVADVTALAAASAGEIQAETVARANGYELVKFDWKQASSHCQVEVSVREGGIFSRPLIFSTAAAIVNRFGRECFDIFRI